MKALLNLVRVGVLMLAAPALFAQGAPDFSNVVIKTNKITDKLYTLEGAGGTIGVLIGPDGVFMVDTQFAPLSDKIAAAIKRLTPQPIKFIVNTHVHGDHTGGNENFAGAGAILVAHENVRHRMSTEQFIEFLKMTEKPSPKGALPVVTFAGSVTFHLNGDEMRAMHVPRAHTDGDAIVHFVGSDVVHMGDVFWNGLYPFVDYSSGGSITGVIAACSQALAMTTDKTRFIPGHGTLGTRAELQAYRDMLATIAARVQQGIAEGKTDEEIVKLAPSREYDEKWGKAYLKPDKFVGSIAAGMRNSGS